jgi:glucan phosphoethanolaminetransferase (alkaline phosphatase superfamily)
MFFAVLGFALVLIMLCSTAEYFAGTVVSLVLLAAVYGFYIVYAYLTAKKGIMNPKFAKSWSGTWVIVCYAVLMLFWIGRLIDEISSGSELYDAVSPIVWLILITEAMLMCLCAKKNNKVLAEQLKEEQEKLDENVRKIRSLDIHTGDEVEKLYLAICRMTLNQAEQIRNR